MADADLYALYQQYGEGLPENALQVIAKLESNHNPKADNPWSSAGGLFQFTDGTAPSYGLTGDLRFDAEAATRAAGEFARDNAAMLRRALGREPTVGELYLAHQQGATGAAALLLNPDRPAVEVLTEVYGDRSRAERVIRQNGGKVSQTGKQFANQWTSEAEAVLKRIPPSEVPNAVATRTDTVRTPPTPVTMSPNLAATRHANQANQAARSLLAGAEMGTPNTASIYAGIYPEAAPKPSVPAPRGAAPSMVFGNGIQQSVSAAQAANNPALQSALEAKLAGAPGVPRPAPVARMSSAQIRADNGQTPQTRQVSLTPRVMAPVPAVQSPQLAATRARDQELQTVLNARYPTRLPPLPPSQLGAPAAPRMTTAQVRQDNGQTRPATTRPSQDLVSTSFASVENARSRGLQARLEERIAAASNTGVGKPPATRIVQSVPFTQAVASTPSNTPQRASRPGPMDQVGNMGSWGDFQSQFGAAPVPRTAMATPAPPNPALGPAAGFVKPPEANERLLEGLPYPATAATLHGLTPNAPIPRPASMRPGAVAPMPMPASMRPMVRAVPQPTRIAPIPAPLSMRPAIAPPRVSPLRVVVQANRPSVPLPVAQITPAAPTQSVVQALRSQGLSPSQAYAMANAANYRPTVEDRVRGSSGGDAHAYSISG